MYVCNLIEITGNKIKKNKNKQTAYIGQQNNQLYNAVESVQGKRRRFFRNKSFV